MGYVYLLMELDKDGNERHKIGITKNHPSKRQKQLQTGNSNVISVLNFYESQNYKNIEKWLHNMYSNQKTETDNEWFSLTNEQVFGFKETCTDIEKKVIFMKENNPFYK